MKASRERFPSAYILPALVLAGLVSGLPLLYAAVLSATDASPGAPGAFVGASNYLRALIDPAFHNALQRSLIFAAGAVILNVGFGLTLAMALRTHPRARAVVQTALLLPWVLSELAVALIWGGFLDERSGMINTFLASFGAGPLSIRTDPAAAMGALWVAALWCGLAFSCMLQMAGLASLPGNLIQAAWLDGASRFRIFRGILWPHQARIIAVNALVVGMTAMVTFALPFALTRGGPLHATELAALFAYRTAFSGNFELGYAAAQGMLMLVAFALTLAALFRLRGSRS